MNAALNHVLAMAIVTRLEDDITGRNGLGNEWEAMDGRTRADLRDEWVRLIMDEMGQSSAQQTASSPEAKEQ